jgi:hypothetical protein
LETPISLTTKDRLSLSLGKKTNGKVMFLLIHNLKRSTEGFWPRKELEEEGSTEMRDLMMFGTKSRRLSLVL